jgi:AcrR family transcriptional regulator
MFTRRARDKDRTIQDILAAARHLFSDKGLYGTSLRDIEAASGVSKGLILHHFGTKERLYAAVQDLLIREYVTMMAEHRQDSKDLKELMRLTIRNSLLYVRANHEYRRIALWAYLEGQERNTELERRFTMALIATMQAGQQSGLVRQDIDPSLSPFIIRGSIEHWIRKERLVRELTAGGKGPEGSSDDRLIDTLVTLFLKHQESEEEK